MATPNRRDCIEHVLSTISCDQLAKQPDALKRRWDRCCAALEAALRQLDSAKDDAAKVGLLSSEALKKAIKAFMRHVGASKQNSKDRDVQVCPCMCVCSVRV